MRVFLDENFPKAAHGFLSECGHEVIDIRGSADKGAEDTHIFEMAQRCKAVFLTTDKDFFHTVPHLYVHHHGVVVITLRQPNRKGILNRLVWLLKHFPENSFLGCVVLLKDQTYVVSPGTGN
ncbi:MAG: DUF5615 family PIN-like protein [bacterium]